MLGDTRVVRELARGMRERSKELWDEAAELVRCVDDVAWTGLAADALRRVVDEQARCLRLAADAHEAAADALDRHAAEVDRVESLVVALGRGADDLVESVGSGVAGLVGHVVASAW